MSKQRDREATTLTQDAGELLRSFATIYYLRPLSLDREGGPPFVNAMAARRAGNLTPSGHRRLENNRPSK